MHTCNSQSKPNVHECKVVKHVHAQEDIDRAQVPSIHSPGHVRWEDRASRPNMSMAGRCRLFLVPDTCGRRGGGQTGRGECATTTSPPRLAINHTSRGRKYRTRPLAGGMQTAPDMYAGRCVGTRGRVKEAGRLARLLRRPATRRSQRDRGPYRRLPLPGHTEVRVGTARHSTAQHGTVRHSTARHGTARHGTARHGTARQSTSTLILLIY